MGTYLSLEYGHREDLPPGHDNEVRTPPHLVEHFLEEYTDPGDCVLDPFAGYGTTLATAERLGREAYGLEYEPEQVTYIESRLDSGTVRQGDVLELDPVEFPACDCCFTSPPFFVRGMEVNPLENYEGESSYDEYLDGVRTAFDRVAQVVRPGGRVVIDVANIRHEGEVTTLAWDVARSVSEVLDFDGEVVVTWTDDADHDRDGTYGYGYDHTYCLVFTVPE